MKKTRVFVAGHRGMVGSALCRLLSSDESVELVLRSRSELDLLDRREVKKFFEFESIDEVYFAAAKVGGIHANNTYPADFIMDNLAIQLNIISEAYSSGVNKLLFLGSSCIYPRDTAQPIREEQLLTGELEPTNEQYALAKIAGIKMCEAHNRQFGTDFRSVMPTNLYGPGDNYHPENSHVVPGMIRRFHEAVKTGQNEVVIWGSGNPQREFLHVDDMAAACVHVMSVSPSQYQSVVSERCSHLNVGTGVDCSIRELAQTIASIVKFKGELKFDTDRPDGTPRKLLDVSRMRELGWKAEIALKDGLLEAYQWYVENHVKT
jgi:GDP-L-fucose synthase